MALTDALDDLISEGRIAPQLAMKILSNFDRSITDTLAERVKTTLTFKVRFFLFLIFDFFSSFRPVIIASGSDGFFFLSGVWVGPSGYVPLL